MPDPISQSLEAIQQYCDATGPLVGAVIKFFVAGGTNIPKPVYYDVAMTQPTIQVVSDSMGYFPQYFMQTGAYRIELYNVVGTLLLSRDYITQGGAAGGTDSYKVLSTSADGVPDYLYGKVLDSATVKWSTANVGGNIKLQAEVDVPNTSPYTVKVNVSGTPGYLQDKFRNTTSISWTASADKMEARYVGPYPTQAASGTDPGYLEQLFQDSDTVSWERVGPQMFAHATVEYPYTLKIDADDEIAGFLGTKIRPGTGVTFTETEDGVNGKQLHVSVNNPDSGKIRVDGDDVSMGYLSTKLVAGANITLTREIIEGADARLRISASPGAALGYMEDVKEFTEAITIGSSTAVFNVCQLDLTAGTWDLSGTATTYAIKDGGAAFIHTLGNIVSTSSGTIPYDGYESFAGVQTVTGGASASANIPRRRFVLATPTTIYLCVQIRSGTFTGALAWGNLSAVQVA